MPDRLVSERTRAEDGNGRARFLKWWSRWRDPLFAAILLPTAIGVFVLGLDKRATDRATKDTAMKSCQRSRDLGPLLADYYARDPAFPRAVLKQYRATIPKTCPK